MPFGNTLTPSIGLSLLKAGLDRRGISSHIRYFTFAFAKTAGSSFYLDIADDREPSIHELGGEWIFARGLFESSPASRTSRTSRKHRPGGTSGVSGTYGPRR